MNAIKPKRWATKNAKGKRTKKPAAIKASRVNKKAVRLTSKKVAATESVPFDRAEAARRAWVTIRANGKVASESAATGVRR